MLKSPSDGRSRITPSKSDSQKLLEAAFYRRAIQSIQAVVVLAERGMTGDARTVLRACVETAILQRRVALDATFLTRLEERHDCHRWKLANAFLKDPQAMRELPRDDVELLKTTVDEINAQYRDRKPTDIDLHDVAASVGGMMLYNIFFRMMSGDAAHGTLNSLVRHVATDKGGNITGLRFGPQLDDLACTLSATATVLLFVLDAAIESFALAEFRPRLDTCLESLKASEGRS